MKPSGQYLISVIIPTCNRSKELTTCVEGLRAAVTQLPVGSYQIIITADGSDFDASGFTSHIVTCIKGPCRGPAANRNHGADFASGEWLAFIDDDCVPDSNLLRAYMDSLKPDTFVYEGKTTCNEGLKSALDHAPENIHGGCLWSCNFMINHNVFDTVGGFDEGFPYAAGEDVDLRERLKMAGYQTLFVPTAIVNHPPRRIKSVAELEPSYVSGAYYAHKRGVPFRMAPMLLATLRARLRRIVRASDHSDSFRAFILLIHELAMIIGKTRKWERRFQ